MDQDVATPDEVGALVLERERLGGPADEANPALGLRRERIDPDDGEAEPFREAVRMPAVAAPDVGDDGALRQLQPGDELVEEIRAPRREALVERSSKLLLDSRELLVRLREPTVHWGSRPGRYRVSRAGANRAYATLPSCVSSGELAL